MKKPLLVLAAVGGIALCSCEQAGLNVPAKDEAVTLPPVSREDTAALVNARPISKLSVDMLADELAKQRGGENVSKQKTIKELIKREILRQQAESEQLPKDPAVAARVENAVRMVLSQIVAENVMKKSVPSEDDMKKEYDQRIGAMKSGEYKARHILVDNEKTALDVIKRLEKGEDFAVLAKKLSKDPGSKNEGGELGWFGAQQMVPPFTNAVIALKNGETTKTPVKTDFGWHVIQREDSREQAPPPFDAVQEQIKSFMQTKKLQGYIEELKNKAKIERLVQYDQKAPEPPPEPQSSGAQVPAEGAHEAATPENPETPAPESEPSASPEVEQ
jgi:peptidyl-prolyl cis-trans isomerase C